MVQVQICSPPGSGGSGNYMPLYNSGLTADYVLYISQLGEEAGMISEGTTETMREVIGSSNNNYEVILECGFEVLSYIIEGLINR